MSSCSRCGRCCIDAKVCDLKGWVSEDRNSKIIGVCDQLVELPDGSYKCLAIQSAFENSLHWDEKSRIWITTVFVGRGCELGNVKVIV